MTDADYWEGLPEPLRAKLSDIAWKFLHLRVVPDRETALELLGWQQLEIEVLDAHAEWLTSAKAAVEGKCVTRYALTNPGAAGRCGRCGLDWTHDNFVRFCREHE